MGGVFAVFIERVVLGVTGDGCVVTAVVVVVAVVVVGAVAVEDCCDSCGVGGVVACGCGWLLFR